MRTGHSDHYGHARSGEAVEAVQLAYPEDGEGSWIARQITSRSLLLATIPILVLGAVTIVGLLVLADDAGDRLESTRLQLTSQTAGQGRALEARTALATTDAFVAERLDDIVDWSRAEPVLTAVTTRRPEVSELAGQPIADIEAEVAPDHLLDEGDGSSTYLTSQTLGQSEYASVLLTDINGFSVGSTMPPEQFVHSEEQWWTEAFNNGAYISPMRYNPSTQAVQFEVALRIDLSSTGTAIGVMRAVVNTTVLGDLGTEYGENDSNLVVQLFTAEGALLSDSSTDQSGVQLGTTEGLDNAAQAAFSELASNETASGFTIVDDTVVGYARSAPTIPTDQIAFDVQSPRWVAVVRQPIDMALAPLSDVDRIGDDLNSSVWSQGLLVLALVALTIGLTWLGARRLAERIARPINDLRDEAIRVADHDLPLMVSSLAAGYEPEEINVSEPIEVVADGEIHDLAMAFATLQSTATDLATSQAIGRNRDVAAVLLNLGRRNQQLIGRQLRYIDQLERDESDPDTLRNLFLLDQMATRMRRNAESLLVLAGEDPPRRGTQPRPPEEVLRAAISEVEDYARVTIAAADPAHIRPHVVSDLTHLLAELIENATNFSAPETTIHVSGEREPDGSYTISIIDRGIGMSPDRLAQANARISDPSFSNDAPTSFLGLYVVGRLAARHDISVRLVESGTAGVAAVVSLPPGCLVDEIRPETGGGTRRPAVEQHTGQHQVSWPAPAVQSSYEPLAAADQPSALEPPRQRPAPQPALGEGEPPLENVGPITAPTPAIRPPSALPDLLESDWPSPFGSTEPTRPTAEEPSRSPLADPGPPLVTPPSQAPAPEPQPAQPAALSEPIDQRGPGRSRSDDETEGMPIPPFRARESMRPEPGAAPDEGQGAPQTFQVKRRVPGQALARSGAPPQSESSPDRGPSRSSDGANGSGSNGGSRADEVRDKLTRFTIGVGAAKAETAAGAASRDDDEVEDDESPVRDSGSHPTNQTEEGWRP